MSNVPPVPDELIDALNKKRCAVFIGAGLSVAVGYPTWDQLLSSLIKRAEKQGIIDAKKKTELEGMSQMPGKWLMVAQELADSYGEGRFSDELVNIFQEVKTTPSEAHRLVTEIPFEFVVTTNYDKLIENAYFPKFNDIPTIFTHANVPDFAGALWRGEFFILKAHGDISHRATIILTEKDYRKVIYASPGYRSLLEAIFTTKTILFLGASLGDPELQLLLRSLHNAFQGSGVYHFALVPSTGFSSAEATHWGKNYNVRCIVYEPSQNHPEVAAFLRNVRDLTTSPPSAPAS